MVIFLYLLLLHWGILYFHLRVFGVACWNIFYIRAALESLSDNSNICAISAFESVDCLCKLRFPRFFVCQLILNCIPHILNSMSWDSGSYLNPMRNVVLVSEAHLPEVQVTSFKPLALYYGCNVRSVIQLQRCYLDLSCMYTIKVADTGWWPICQFTSQSAILITVRLMHTNLRYKSGSS